MIKIEKLETIQQLMKDGIEEGLTLDYKRDIGGNSDIANDVCAFANTVGGVLVYGVIENNRKPVELSGVDPSGVEEKIRNVVRDSIQPNVVGIEIKLFPLEKSDKCIVVVEIPESLEAPHMSNHRYYKRQGSKSDPMEDYEVKTSRFKKGFRIALVEEITENLEMATKTRGFLQKFMYLNQNERKPVMFIPFHDEAWKSLISSGYLIYLPSNLANKLRRAYALIHEVNALSDFSRVIPGQPTEIGNLMLLNVIHTPVEDRSNNSGTYIFAVIEQKIVQLISALTDLKSEV